MYEPPRVALMRAVSEGKQIAAEILRLQLRVAAGFITEDEAVSKYEVLLRRVDAVRGLAEQAQGAVRELSPPTLPPVPDDMSLGLAELRTLAAELRRDPTSRAISTEMARVSGEKIQPAAEEWYASSTGTIGVITADGAGPSTCGKVKRVVLLGRAGMGVGAAAVAMPALD